MDQKGGAWAALGCKASYDGRMKRVALLTLVGLVVVGVVVGVGVAIGMGGVASAAPARCADGGCF